MAKKALLIGCNYPRTMDEMKASVNDILVVKQWLMKQYSFCEENITIMVDTNTVSSSINATCLNILFKIGSLVENATAEDVLTW